MQRSDFFDKPGVVSVWLGMSKPEPDESVDILRDLCGVQHYDLDFQDVVAVGDFEKAPVEDLLRLLSYSSSYLFAAIRQAKKLKITSACWAMSQGNYAYDPTRVFVPVADDPVFLGCFAWSDAK